MVEKFELADGKIFLRSEQNVEPLLDRNKSIANSRVTDGGIKKGFMHGCTLPATVQMEMMKKGINPHPRTPKDWRLFWHEVETNYSHFKTTHKKLG